MKFAFDFYSHVLLFIFLVIMLLCFPFFTDLTFSTELFKLLFSLVLIISIFALTHRRRDIVIASLFALTAIVASWSDELLGMAHNRELISLIATILFFAYVIVIHLKQLIAKQQIDQNVLWAAMCNYILIGLFWGYIYALLDLIIPGSFHIAETSNALMVNLTDAKLNAVYVIPHFIYYSFSTLTTLGYGDIVPVSPVVQSLASFEAIAGQFYLTVLVARLVALYVSQQQ